MSAPAAWRTCLPVLASLALSAAAPAARAQFVPAWEPQVGPRAYASVGAGASSYTASCGNSPGCDRVGNVVRGALGVFLAPGFGLEVAAADFGTSRIGSRDGEAEFGARMVGIGLALPVDYGTRFNGLLRFGLASVRSTLEAVAPGAARAASSTSAEGYYGFTMGYMVAPNLAVELSFDGTRAYVDEVGGRVDALTLGLSLRF